MPCTENWNSYRVIVVTGRGESFSPTLTSEQWCEYGQRQWYSILSWFPPSKWRLTGRIKSADVLIWSGGTGSGLPLITENGEALWAIAFLMGRRANRTVHSLIWNSSLIFMNYELDSVVKKKCIYITPLTSVTCFMCAVFSLHFTTEIIYFHFSPHAYWINTMHTRVGNEC